MSKFHTIMNDAAADSSRNNTSHLGFSILLNFIITIAEIIGGLISGSLSLLSDALHNFSDTASLLISLLAVKISTRSPDRKRTFGYRRAQIIGALINLISLVIVAFYLIKEAIERYLNPQPIQGGVMLVVAVIGLLANLGTAVLLYRQSKNNLNIRSTFIHIMGDTYSSVGVVLASLLITRYRFYLADTLMTLLISAYILFHTLQLLRQTINILMQGVPDDINIEEIITAVESLEDVQDIHHIHVWQLDETQASLEAHVVIDPVNYQDMDCIKQSIKDRLAETFNITHSTLEFEFANSQEHPYRSCYQNNV